MRLLLSFLHLSNFLLDASAHQPGRYTLCLDVWTPFFGATDDRKRRGHATGTFILWPHSLFRRAKILLPRACEYFFSFLFFFGSFLHSWKMDRHGQIESRFGSAHSIFVYSVYNICRAGVWEDRIHFSGVEPHAGLGNDICYS